MIPLILSILSSSLIFVIFKMFAYYKIDTLQAIIVNYLTAAAIGLIFFIDEWVPEAGESLHWLTYALLISFLLISLFFLMARSSQENGVAATSVSVKMSMAISLLLMIFIYRESAGILKISGILLAILGVYLISSGGKDKELKKSNSYWMLAVLFAGNGMLDFILNYVQKFVLTVLTPSLFAAFAFGTAGILGIVVLFIKALSKKPQLAVKNLVAGFLLGIPNFFSIYFLLLSYRTTGWSDTTVLSITNVSVVLTSALVGYLVFKEVKTIRKLIGLAVAVAAIATLYFANIHEG